MNELIKISNSDGKETVNARELYDFLGIKRNYLQWIKPYTISSNEYGFQLDVDFCTSTFKSKGRPRTDHHLSIEMAKQMSMMARSEKGRQAREYFIDCEKKLKEIPNEMV